MRTGGLGDRLGRHLDPESRYGLRLTLFAVAVLLAAVPFGLLVDQVVRSGPLTRADTSAAEHLHDWVRRSPGVVGPLRVVTFLGTPAWLAGVVAATAAYALARRRRRLALLVVLTALVGGALNLGVKMAVDRERPEMHPPTATAGGNSFPSGHATSSTVSYGSVLLVVLPAVPRRARRGAVAGVVVLVAAIGASRLALGVHYLSDVLGGFALGSAWLAASTAAFSVWRVERGGRPVDAIEGLEPDAAVDLDP